MFIVIKNENSDIFNNLSVNVVKSLNGVFTRSDLEKELVDVNFDKVIIDLTSINDYSDNNNVFEFLDFFGNQDKVILVVNNDYIANNKEFISNIIGRGYYNFTNSSVGIIKLIQHSNSFDDVRSYVSGYDYLRVDSSSTDFNLDKVRESKTIIGIENGVPHSGATTLMYMLVKQISEYKNAKGIEMFRDDSLYFKDDRIVTCQSRAQFETIISSLKDVDIFIVDLNGSDVRNLCNKIIYLVEPGAAKINKIVKGDRDTYNKIVNSYVVLNRSNIKNEDITTFEYETKFKVVGNIPNLNERLDSNDSLDGLVKYLVGDIKRKKGGFWNLFKKNK